MKFARIDLSKTSYPKLDNWSYIEHPNIVELNNIYSKYCRYKKFESVMPIFDTQYQDVNIDVIGYYHEHKLVAFSLIKRHDYVNAEALQFAWDYVNPELRLGIESLKNECAIYKSQGFEYLYVGQADEYKSKINGYEILGPL